MGIVLEAAPAPGSARPPDERWAVKVLRSSSDGESHARFVREIRICASMQHPGIVPILDWGTLKTDGSIHPFFVMERLHGSSLNQILDRGRDVCVAPRQAVAWTTSALQALQAAHQSGVVHRDVKPGNIFVVSSTRVVLVDFGLARNQGAATLTATQSLLGTPGYMSLEHFGELHTMGPTGDIFSMGCVLFEMLCNQVPFPFRTVWDLVYKLMHATPPTVTSLNVHVSDKMSGIVSRMLAPKAERYQTAQEVLDDLLAYGGE
jgi:serine/threonine-protein kinase